MLGKFCTQFISFLLVPLYTHKLNTDDFGTVDLIHTYISLLTPLLILRFDSAVFRFLIDERGEEDDSGKKAIVTNAIITIFVVGLLFSAIYFILPIFFTISNYWLIYANIIVMMFSSIMLQITRGLGSNKDYSIASVISGITIATTNIVLILALNFGAESILIASIIGNLLCTLYLAIRMKVRRYIKRSKFDKTRLKTMLKYSIPMMPNSVSWWVVNVSDRTIISAVLGVAMNGIYAISCKFSNIIDGVFSVFNMSWQESASIHINDEDRDGYFSKMSNELFCLFAYGIIVLLAVLPLIYGYVVGENYSESYIYIPVLLVANLFHIAIQIIGGVYVAKKETKKIMNTTIVSAILNLGINLAFINQLGLFAACISTLVAYAAMAIYRFFDVKKILRIKLDFKKILPIIPLFAITIFAFYLKNNIVSVSLSACACILAVCFNINSIKDFVMIFKKKKK